MSDIVITTAAERPEYVGREYELNDSWPEFIGHDRIANALLNEVMPTFPEYCSIATVGDTVIARARAIPYDAEGPGCELFPDGSWDTVQIWGFDDHRAGRRSTAASALEIAIDQAYLGQGLSYRMLTACGKPLRRRGFRRWWRRSGQPTNTASRTCRWPTICGSPAKMGCRPTRGCGCTCAPAGCRSA